MVESVKERTRAELPGHLIELPDESWSFWRCAGLRGAGFPAEEVLKLGAPEGASAADRLLVAEDYVNSARARAFEEVNASLDALRRSNEWGDKEKRAPLLDALRLLKMGKIPTQSVDGRAGEALEAVRETSVRIESARENYDEAFKSSVGLISRSIHEIASSDHFREAVTWQNRNALHTAIDVLLRRPPGGPRNSKQRQYEELIANYVQRYCVKNDTIGFFGPVGWARFVEEGEPLTCKPGQQFLATRKVYFEYWCIESLAKAIARHKAARPWIIPIRMPFVRVEGLSLHHPLFGSTKISADQAAILKACDGAKTAKEISREVIRSPYANLTDEAQVCKLLEEMSNRGLVFWNFNIPIEAYPERTLRSLLDRIGDEQVRAPALAALDELESARAAIANSAGDAEKLDKALGDLESTFVRLTGQASTRSHGKTYAARTLVYEDCRRDIEVNVGLSLLEDLAPPVSLLLTSARWYTYEFAKIYRARFKQIYADLVREAGSPTVDAAQFWMRALPYIFGDQSHIGDCVSDDFQSRWASILSLPYNERRVEFRSERLRSTVESAFAAPRPGWRSARYHCPDVMIAANGIDAIRQGDFKLVMGELHLAGNTLGGSLFVEQHPSPQEILRNAEIDTEGIKALPMTPRDFPDLTARTNYVLISPNDFRLEFSRDSFSPRRSKALQIASLLVQELDGALTVRTRDGRHQFDLIEIIGGTFMGMVVDAFRILSTHPHTPRVTIDKVVISRETWQFAPSDLAFAFEKDDADRFLAARRWARSHGMPRFVFTKVPVEVKPFYLDFSSPIYVDIFSRMVRRTVEANPPGATVKVTEMFPTPDLTWLPDAQGRRYTSEFRIVAVDLAI